jgi:hypothetical protein
MRSGATFWIATGTRESRTGVKIKPEAGLTYEGPGRGSKAIDQSLIKGRSNEFPQAKDAVHSLGGSPERILGHKGRTVAKQSAKSLRDDA